MVLRIKNKSEEKEVEEIIREMEEVFKKKKKECPGLQEILAQEIRREDEELAQKINKIAEKIKRREEIPFSLPKDIHPFDHFVTSIFIFFYLKEKEEGSLLILEDYLLILVKSFLEFRERIEQEEFYYVSPFPDRNFSLKKEGGKIEIVYPKEEWAKEFVEAWKRVKNKDDFWISIGKEKIVLIKRSELKELKFCLKKEKNKVLVL